MIENVLAIETSCDDTSVAIVRRDGWVHGMVSANQDLAHAVFGGVVPEIASRNHTITLLPLVEQALKKSQKNWDAIGGVVVTSRPGLLGSLLVGVVTAKSLALAKGIPLLGVNHLEGHLLAPFLSDEAYAPSMSLEQIQREQTSYLALAISGGHTQLYSVDEIHKYRVLGRTIDDAAGEAFDKLAKMVGLPFPGGVAVDRLARDGDPQAYAFPRPFIHEAHLNFSFSGLKTSALRLIESLEKEEVEAKKADICASYQEAIVDVLISRLNRACEEADSGLVILTGGVSANSRLRSRAQEWAHKKGIQLMIPPLKYCTDNAAMIGLAGVLRLNRGERSEQNLAPQAASEAGDFIGATL